MDELSEEEAPAYALGLNALSAVQCLHLSTDHLK